MKEQANIVVTGRGVAGAHTTHVHPVHLTQTMERVPDALFKTRVNARTGNKYTRAFQVCSREQCGYRHSDVRQVTAC
jgi:hypothetical protein